MCTHASIGRACYRPVIPFKGPLKDSDKIASSNECGNSRAPGSESSFTVRALLPLLHLLLTFFLIATHPRDPRDVIFLAFQVRNQNRNKRAAATMCSGRCRALRVVKLYVFAGNRKKRALSHFSLFPSLVLSSFSLSFLPLFPPFLSPSIFAVRHLRLRSNIQCQY